MSNAAHQAGGWPRATRLAMLLALAFPAASHAQSTQADNTKPAESTLPEVQVRAEEERADGPVQGYVAKRSATATKTDTPLIETPQAVTVVPRDQIVDQGAGNLQDALNYAAGVRSDAYGLDTRTDSVRVRGANPDEYLDGIRKTFGYYTSNGRTEPYTLERIEVLRGAAAMLYGQGTTGGVINMVTKRPLEQAYREFAVQVGSYGRTQIQTDLTGPLNEDGSVLYRLVALGRKSDTQVDHVPDDRLVISPSLTWKISGRTSLTLNALYQDDKTGSSSQFFPWSGTLTSNPNGQIPTNRFIGEPGWDRYNTRRQALGWQFEHQFSDDWKFRQSARYSDTQVDYRSAYADSFSLAGGYNADPVGQRRVDRYVYLEQSRTRVLGVDNNLEGNFSTGSWRHKILVGVDAISYTKGGISGSGMAAAIDVYNPTYGNFTEPSTSTTAKNRQVQTGVYLQDQIKITPKWLVMLGLRNDHVVNKTAGSADEKSSATTSRAGLMYLADNGVAPYLSYSESFTPVANINSQSFKPLRGEQWEAGVKYQPAGRDLFLAANVYDWYENNQVKETVPTVYTQLGRTHTRGIELEARGKVTRHFDVIAHYNYIELDPTLEGIPRHQAAVWGKYGFSVGDITGLSVGTGVRYMSAFHDGSAPTVPSVTLLDALLAWDTPKWRLALNVINLTDKTYVATCLSRGDCWYGSKRNATLTLTYRW